MLKYLKTVLTVVLAALILATVFFTSSKKSEKTFFALDTVITLSAKGQGVKDALSDAEAEIKKIEKSISAYDKSSDILTGQLTDISKTVVERGLYFGELSDGVFDISIKPLTTLWNIGAENPEVPKKEQIEEALKKVDYKNIKIQNDRLILPDGFAIDLGGIGKGYASDRAAECLKSAGIGDAVLNLGGNVTVLGTKKIGIQNPFSKTNGDYLGYVEVTDRSVVTSGDYERFFTENGEKYHHILDTTTGYPAKSGIVSATVISESAMDADAVSTICFILGKDRGIAFAKEHGFSVMLVDKEGRIYKTDDFHITITNTQFKKEIFEKNKKSIYKYEFR